MKKYRTILCVPDNKFEILEKGRIAGMDLRLSCPDNLACFDDGIDISWLGEIINEEYQKHYQIQIITRQPIENFEAKHPLSIFLELFEKIEYVY